MARYHSEYLAASHTTDKLVWLEIAWKIWAAGWNLANMEVARFKGPVGQLEDDERKDSQA